MTKILVSAEPLRQLLNALNGPGHHIRELQALRGPLVGDDNPINILVAEFNDHAGRFPVNNFEEAIQLLQVEAVGRRQMSSPELISDVRAARNALLAEQFEQAAAALRTFKP